MTMHTQFGELDLDDLIDEDPPPSTKRMPGSATFDVEDKMTALFVSATWQLVASYKDASGVTVIAQSTEQPKAHSPAFLKRWGRAVIRQNQKKLRKMGVDVDATYLRFGGILEDLEETD
jgi:hypothetical protein